jgi:hypothetical protein
MTGKGKKTRAASAALPRGFGLGSGRSWPGRLSPAELHRNPTDFLGGNMPNDNLKRLYVDVLLYACLFSRRSILSAILSSGDTK